MYKKNAILCETKNAAYRGLEWTRFEPAMFSFRLEEERVPDATCIPRAREPEARPGLGPASVNARGVSLRFFSSRYPSDSIQQRTTNTLCNHTPHRRGPSFSSVYARVTQQLHKIFHPGKNI